MIICISFFLLSLSLSSPDPPPGSGRSIARRFLLTLLTQFAERNIFLYLLRQNYKGNNCNNIHVDRNHLSTCIASLLLL